MRTSNDNFSLTVHLIKQLDLQDALSLYGIELRGNQACCPFHADDTPSFGIYTVAKGQRLHCLGCGWDGDLIQFVRDRYGLGFRDAVSQICADFHLSAPEELKAEDRKRLVARQTEAQRRKAAIDLAEEVRRAREFMCEIADDILQSIPPAQRNKDNEFYVDAVFRRMAAEREFGRAEMRMYNLTHNK